MNGKDRMGQSDGSSLRLEKDHPFLLNMRCSLVLLYVRYKKKIKSTFKYTTAKHQPFDCFVERHNLRTTQ